MKIIVIIPHYNHQNTITEIVDKIIAFDIPCLVIDDASNNEALKILNNLSKKNNVYILYKKINEGKGSAVKEGIKKAIELGYTHAIQIDADAQHQVEDIEKFIIASKNNTNAVICANPVYNESIPKSRLFGRKITNFWIKIHTLSNTIKDGMCGFRSYPLKKVYEIIENEKVGNRMDFDIEILVYLKWYNVPFIWINSKINYPKDGISHFKMFSDNLLISKTHTKLFFKMIAKLIKIKNVRKK